MLLIVDVLGLVVAFIAREPLMPSLERQSYDKVSPGYEYAAFLLAIPLWILLLRLEGLYDRDEERTDHSTVDDIVGVFRSVTSASGCSRCSASPRTPSSRCSPGSDCSGRSPSR